MLWRKAMKYRVLIEADEDGAFIAHVPALQPSPSGSLGYCFFAGAFGLPIFTDGSCLSSRFIASSVMS